MNLDAMERGTNPPDDINVIIEVPIGGEPIKYELDKASGILHMEDDGGLDEKILAVPSSKISRRYEDVITIEDLPAITLEQIQHFFEHYKDLEPGKWVKIRGLHGVDAAKKMIIDAIARV